MPHKEVGWGRGLRVSRATISNLDLKGKYTDTQTGLMPILCKDYFMSKKII